MNELQRLSGPVRSLYEGIETRLRLDMVLEKIPEKSIRTHGGFVPGFDAIEHLSMDEVVLV